MAAAKSSEHSKKIRHPFDKGAYRKLRQTQNVASWHISEVDRMSTKAGTPTLRRGRGLPGLTSAHLGRNATAYPMV